MMREERRYELVVSAVVAAVFAAFWVVAVVTSDHPRTFDEHVQLAIIWAVLATPPVIATRLLSRAWWSSTGVRGAGTLMVPRGSGRTAVLAVVVAAVTAMIAGLLAGYLLPTMQLFAVTFAALVAAMGTVVVARLRSGRQALPDPVIAIAVVVGVFACIAVTGYFMAKHPDAAEHLSTTTAAIFGVGLAGLLWSAVIPPRMLVGNRITRGVAIVWAVLLGLGFVLASRFSGDRSGGVASYLVFVTVVIPLLGSALVAWLSRSLRGGIHAAVLATALGTPLIFVRWLLEAPHWHQNNAGLLLDSETAPIGEDLVDAIQWAFVVLPVWGLSFGVIGAALGSAWRRRARAIRESDPPPEGDTILL
jgi:hypothetical protein